MRLFMALAFLLATVSAADARTRITVRKQITLRDNPYAVQFLLSAITCVFVAWSVPPDTPAGSPRLGRCPPRNAITPLRAA